MNNNIDTAKVVVLLSIVFITISEAIAQVCIKKSHKDGMPVLLYIGIIFYGFVCILLMNCYSNGANMGRVNLIWSCVSIISIITVGYFIFEEKIYTHDIIAILFAIGAIYFANQ
jgi:multidrug transporter EmrE-like cation transporter